MTFHTLTPSELRQEIFLQYQKQAWAVLSEGWKFSGVFLPSWLTDALRKGSEPEEERVGNETWAQLCVSLGTFPGNLALWLHSLDQAALQFPWRRALHKHLYQPSVGLSQRYQSI